MKRAATPWLAPVIAAVVALALCLAQPFYALDMLICDPLYAQLRAPDARTIIVAIDEETLDEYGSFGTWSRAKTAQLLDWLYEDPATAPALVGLDINFQGATNAEDDAALAAACEDRTVIVAGSLVYRGAVTSQGGSLAYDAWNVADVEAPYPELAAAAQTGYSNAYVAPDGIVRQAMPTANVQGEALGSLSWLLASARADSDGTALASPATDGQGLVQFFYAGKPGDFAHVSLADVLAGRVPRSEFAGKTVLVGAWASGMQDAYMAASSHSTMNGVEVNANIMQALLEGRTATPAPTWPHAVVVAALAAVLAWALRGRPLGLAVGAVLVAAALHLAAGWLLARNGLTISQAYAMIVLVLLLAYLIVDRYVLERLRRRRALAVFSQYVEPKVVESLSTEDASLVQLRGETRQVSVLFVDIRGFTSMSEGMAPEHVVGVLNEYLGMVTECIFRHGGMLDKYVGDCAMAVFNAPFDQDDYLYESVACAWDIARGGKELASRLQERFGRDIGYGVGVHCGPAVVGNIGCEFRMDYTAIGDTVNTAARLEANAPRNQIYISRQLADALAGRIDVEEVGALALKGKVEPFPVLRVTGMAAKGGAPGDAAGDAAGDAPGDAPAPAPGGAAGGAPAPAPGGAPGDAAATDAAPTTRMEGDRP